MATAGHKRKKTLSRSGHLHVYTTVQPDRHRPDLGIMTIGKKHWAIAEDYFPPYSHGLSPQMTRREAAYILNAGDEAAQVEIIRYFEPLGPQSVGCRTPAQPSPAI
jgi:hypothetical protein